MMTAKTPEDIAVLRDELASQGIPSYFLVRRTTPCGYDEYDAFVVVAWDDEDARKFCPYHGGAQEREANAEFPAGTWVAYKDTETEWLGPCYNQERGYSPIQSFNAG